MNVGFAKEHLPEARGAFVTPASQMPMSVPLSEERKEELVHWARTKRAFLIEDGTPDLLSLDGVYRRPLVTLPGAQEVTVYLSSFSLAFFPDIKIAYLVVPESLSAAFAGGKILFDRNTSGRNQEILARFLRTDDYDTYVRRVTRHYRTNYRCLCNAAAQHLSPFGTLSSTTHGPHTTFRFDVPLSDQAVSDHLDKVGITARPLSRFAGAFPEHRGLLLGFGGFSTAEIESGIVTIAQCCTEALNSLAKERGQREAAAARRRAYSR